MEAIPTLLRPPLASQCLIETREGVLPHPVQHLFRQQFACNENGRIVSVNTGHTQKNGAASTVNTVEIAPFFCVCPVL
jgi:hypothetical protein